MKLYFLTRNSLADYDEHAGFVVRAKSPNAARKIVAAEHFDLREKKVWLEESGSKCVRLKDDGEEGVVISDFNAG